MKSNTKMIKCQRGEQNSAGKMHALNMHMFNTPINVCGGFTSRNPSMFCSNANTVTFNRPPVGKIRFLHPYLLCDQMAGMLHSLSEFLVLPCMVKLMVYFKQEKLLGSGHS